MMKRHPLTTVGLKAFQEELFRCDDEQLFREAAAMAEDCRAYLPRRFEIDVFRLEAIRSLDEKMARTIGWCLAAALINRQPLLVKGAVLTAMISVNREIEGCTIGLECTVRGRLT